MLHENKMKTIFEITQDHLADRHEAQERNPIEWVMRNANEVLREADRAQQDPSLLALASHFAVELEQQLKVTGINLHSGLVQGLATSAIAVAIREWIAVNEEYEAQLAPPTPKQLP
jgi:hypothetical protein